ncbi:response regulator transcription factor [Komarekiella sp. 'clone 1']|uniref:Response regulator transcription factor n=1 Tax=Komarekiella delphini-convector SJRDD-AB1 TaxID=2593771 RepID=A0AA40SW29_9NOST|nr:response regulator [Komarekiella delphini-convector]MBD6616328.1 response regulator transcription factor [Komarekiella delphini-convector SJRDD-AB1]
MNQILIVEDEAGVSAFLEKGLQRQGYTTTIAEDGQQALLLAQNNEFDLILLDLGLPLVDGWTVLKELRRQGKTLPIIIVTARKDNYERATALINGADDYITKPFRFSDLLERIQIHLSHG